MAQAFIGVGSNVGDRQGFIDRAYECLSRTQGVRILCCSPVYETEPVGGPKQGKYLNAVWKIETSLVPEQLMGDLLAIEKELGRERTEQNAPRTIDLDLLFWDQQIIDRKGLIIPHPRLQERLFVLDPLSDLAPEWRHPVFKKTIRELREALRERNS
jgi:2-amino-4-hydroxy-6-hydroxymethyldihydropteridine diphosphokinase